MFSWKHPNHYKELEKERKKLEEELKRQASSNKQKGESNDKEKQQAVGPAPSSSSDGNP
tara:strand:- start:1163 stop:1339 length:177 start_codon:yes stop_codon:yes gene_type:complete